MAQKLHHQKRLASGDVKKAISSWEAKTGSGGDVKKAVSSGGKKGVSSGGAAKRALSSGGDDWVIMENDKSKPSKEPPKQSKWWWR